MALPLVLLFTVLLGLATTATITAVCWRAVPLRVVSLVLVGVHLLLLGLLLFTPALAPSAPLPGVVTI
jgi:hypothetical protein